MRIAARALPLAALVAASVPAAAEELPKLKPGLWRMTRTGDVKRTDTVCVTAHEGQPTLRGDFAGGTCAPPTVARISGGHTETIVCQMGDLTLTTIATIRGDYERKVRYDFVMEGSEPAILAGAPPKVRRLRWMTVRERLGDCR